MLLWPFLGVFLDSGSLFFLVVVVAVAWFFVGG